MTEVTVSASTSPAVSPDDPRFYLQRAAAELKAKDYAAAEKDATKAMDMGYRKSSAFNTRAAARTGLGRFKEACADADLAVQVNPGGAAGYLARAAAREGMNAPASDILADFEKAAELDKKWKSVFEDAKRRYAGAAAPAEKPAPAPAAPAPTPEPAPKPAPAPVSAPAKEPLPWKPVAGVVGGAALLALLIAQGLRGHRARRVRFGSVMSVPMPPGDEPSVGAVLGGKYILGKAAGSEDGADLFEARDLEDRPRLLKRLKRGDATALARAKAAGALDHPAILAVEAVFEYGGHIYLACEAGAGEPLRLSLARAPEHRLAPEAAMRVVQSACDALDYAHGRGIFHGHLTLSHILVERAKVQIKGFALPAEAAESDYLAPENGNAARAESDVYSLGVCLYEMLTGVRPFSGPEAGQNKTEGRFAPASTLVPKLAEGIDELLARALAPDPARRFRSAAELFAAYRNLVIPGVH